MLLVVCTSAKVLKQGASLSQHRRNELPAQMPQVTSAKALCRYMISLPLFLDCVPSHILYLLQDDYKDTTSHGGARNEPKASFQRLGSQKWVSVHIMFMPNSSILRELRTQLQVTGPRCMNVVEFLSSSSQWLVVRFTPCFSEVMAALFLAERMIADNATFHL